MGLGDCALDSQKELIGMLLKEQINARGGVGEQPVGNVGHPAAAANTRARRQKSFEDVLKRYTWAFGDELPSTPEERWELPRQIRALKSAEAGTVVCTL